MTEESSIQAGQAGGSGNGGERAKLLPWIALLLAAVVALLLLDRGCGSQDADGSLTPVAEDNAVQKEINLSADEKSGRHVVSGAGVLADMTQALASQSANSNTAYILDEVRFLDKTAGFVQLGTGQLKGLTDLLRKYPGLRIRIEAHTDNTGNARENLQLSVDQALAVKQYLQDKGIVPERMSVVGRGQYKPIAPNSTGAGRARNNRVEVYLITGQ